MAMDCFKDTVVTAGPGSIIIKINLTLQTLASVTMECDGASCISILPDLKYAIIGCFDAWYIHLIF